MPAMTRLQNIVGLLLVTLSFVTNICNATPDTMKIRESIVRIAEKISKYKTVDDKAVGFAGLATDQYKRFYSFTQQATDNELVILTDHYNEKVRAYAFWALAKRNFIDIRIVLDKHLGDTTSFDFYSGCMVTSERINYFFLEVLTPDHIDQLCIKLSDKEINNYYKRITDITEQKKKLAGI